MPLVCALGVVSGLQAATAPIPSDYWGLVDSSPYPFVIQNASIYRQLVDSSSNVFGYETFCLKEATGPFTFTSGTSSYTGVLITTNNMPGLSADTCFLLFVDGQTFAPLAMTQLYPSVQCSQDGVVQQPPAYPGQQGFTPGVTIEPCPTTASNVVPTWLQGAAYGGVSAGGHVHSRRCEEELYSILHSPSCRHSLLLYYACA